MRACTHARAHAHVGSELITKKRRYEWAHVYTHVYKYVHKHVYTRVYKHEYKHVYKRRHRHVHGHEYGHACMDIGQGMSMDTFIEARVPACLWTCV